MTGAPGRWRHACTARVDDSTFATSVPESINRHQSWSYAFGRPLAAPADVTRARQAFREIGPGPSGSVSCSVARARRPRYAGQHVPVARTRRRIPSNRCRLLGFAGLAVVEAVVPAGGVLPVDARTRNRARGARGRAPVAETAPELGGKTRQVDRARHGRRVGCARPTGVRGRTRAEREYGA